MEGLEQYFELKQQEIELSKQKMQIEKNIAQNKIEMEQWGKDYYTDKCRKEIKDKARDCNDISSEMVKKLEDSDNNWNDTNKIYSNINTFAENEAILENYVYKSQYNIIKDIHDIIFGGKKYDK